MNRFTAKLAQGAARLAFWRKSAAPTLGQPEVPAPEAFQNSSPIEANPEAAVDAPAPPPGRLARLKQALRIRRNPAPEPSPEPDQAVAIEAPSGERDDASAAADAMPAHKLSLLTRLKNRLRRQPELPPSEAADMGAATLGAERRTEAVASSDDASADDENAEHVGRTRRVLAVLSSKWVWIPGLSVVLLALMGALMLMLLQSAQEKEHLQEELLATKKKLEQTITKKAAAERGASGQAGTPAVAAVADSNSGIDDGDCAVTDKESVIRNLKNCIDSFNNSQDPPARAEPATQLF